MVLLPRLMRKPLLNQWLNMHVRVLCPHLVKIQQNIDLLVDDDFLFSFSNEWKKS